MSLLDLAQRYVPLHRVSREWHGPCPFCGTSQSNPALSDRFWVNEEKGRYYCRQCTPQGGSAVNFVMRMEGKSCPEAHESLGLRCTSTTCPGREKCPLGDGKAPGVQAPRPLAPPKEAKSPEFVPSEVTDPQELWRERAGKLIAEAHAALLANAEQMAFLAARGLPLEAVERYRLGWIAGTIFRPREAWGLAEKINTETKKPKKLWIPRGILIPTIIEDVPHRLRIRRPAEDLRERDGKYIEVEGSGNDRVILNPQAKAVVVIESDLDALLVDWHAGDLVGAMPTVSASAKPKTSTWPLLQAALCILVASDFELVWSDEKQRWVSAGGSAAKWWQQQFPRAKRWPVPEGKDPGEYFQAGGDVRAWVMAGLPPVFHVAPPQVAAAVAEAPVSGQVSETAEAKGETAAAEGETAPGCIVGVSQGGIPYLVADRAEDLAQLQAQHPGHAAFCRSEMRHLKDLPAAVVHEQLLLRRQFPGSHILTTQPLPASAEQVEG